MKQTADEILKKHEDANEMHFYEVDRKWIIEAMYEYATFFPREISDEEIKKAAIKYADKVYDKSDFKDEWRGVFNDFISAAKWYREQLKQRQ